MTIKVTYNVTDVYMTQSVSPVYINVSYSDGGASGGGVWGSITGTLSNQTDLQTALDLKVPYSGATGNVNLGEYELKAGQVTLDTSPTGTAAVGTTRWNDTTGTSETTLKGGNVIIKNGVDLVARVVNKVTPNTTLTKAAYQAVRVSGAQGQRLAVAFAQANNDANSADTIGIVIETIPTNQEGFIMTVGQLEGINTTGSLQGETWADGDVLYLSPTTPGAITNVKPTGATGHLVIIGYVEYAHANNGKLYIKVANGFEIDELHNVSIVSPTNNQGLFYNSSNSLWENKTISTALGYTPVPTTRNITINGVTYDLSADRTWTISTGISGSGASGQVTYWTGASAVSGSNNLFWDNANGRLGVGTNAPSTALHVIGDTIIRGSGATTALTVQNNSSTNLFRVNNDGNVSIGFTGALVYKLELQGGNFRISNTGATQQLILGYSGGGYNYIGSATNTPLNFFINETTRAVLFTTGNFSLGTTSDLGVRLGVVGDTLLRGSGATSATTALTVQNSSSTNLFTVRNDGLSTFGGDVTLSKNFNGPVDLSISNTTAGTLTQSRINLTTNSGTGIVAKLSTLSTAYKYLNASDYYIYNATAGDISILNDFSTGQIKMGAGGASSPHLTIKSNGRINMSSLPTSSTGLAAGDLWNDAGTVKIV